MIRAEAAGRLERVRHQVGLVRGPVSCMMYTLRSRRSLKRFKDIKVGQIASLNLSNWVNSHRPNRRYRGVGRAADKYRAELALKQRIQMGTIERRHRSSLTAVGFALTLCRALISFLDVYNSLRKYTSVNG